MHNFDLKKKTTSGHLFTFYKHFNYYFKYHDTVLYSGIFGSDTQLSFTCSCIAHPYPHNTCTINMDPPHPK